MPPTTVRTSSDLPLRPCVGILLINATGHIFVGERLDTPGAWQMPQGGIDPGEDVKTAGLRELEEETGVRAEHVDLLAESPSWLTYDLPPHLLGKSWGGKYRGQKQRWLALELKAPDSVIKIDTAHPEFARWQWSNKARILETIVDFKLALYRDVFRFYDTVMAGRHISEDTA